MANEKYITGAIVIIVGILLLVAFSTTNKSEPTPKNDSQKLTEESKQLQEVVKAISDLNSNLDSMASDQRELAFKISEIEVKLDTMDNKYKSMNENLNKLTDDSNNIKNNNENKQDAEKEKSKEVENQEPPTKEIEKRFMKSQFGEDRYVYETFFKNPLKRNGFFLEVGALNGVLFSNTYFFENALGWDGILIEATPKTAELMQKNRKASYKFHGGVCEKKKVIQIISSGLDAVNGNPDNMSEKFKDKFHNDNKPKKIFDVECNTLTHYINQSGRNYIDFMIVDVEGGEYDALKGFDWENISVGVWAVEISEPELEKNIKIKEMLTQHGYVYQHRLHLSEIWVNKKLLN